MPAILCVGDEPALNRSRAAVLRTLDCHVVEAESSAAIPLLDTLAYDMVILCHTVPAGAASDITVHASVLARQPRVVRIESPFGATTPPANGVFHIDPSGGPRVLLDSVRRAFDLPANERDGLAARAFSAPAYPRSSNAHRKTAAAMARSPHR